MRRVQTVAILIGLLAAGCPPNVPPPPSPTAGPPNIKLVPGDRLLLAVEATGVTKAGGQATLSIPNVAPLTFTAMNGIDFKINGAYAGEMHLLSDPLTDEQLKAARAYTGSYSVDAKIARLDGALVTGANGGVRASLGLWHPQGTTATVTLLEDLGSPISIR